MPKSKSSKDLKFEEDPDAPLVLYSIARIRDTMTSTSRKVVDHYGNPLTIFSNARLLTKSIDGVGPTHAEWGKFSPCFYRGLPPRVWRYRQKKNDVWQVLLEIGEYKVWVDADVLEAQPVAALD